MDDRTVVIVGTGLVTPVGLCTRQTVAEVRSGQSRFAESPFSDDRYRPVVMSLIPDGMVPPVGTGKLPPREADLASLAALALAECLSHAPAGHAPIAIRHAWPARDATIPLDAKRLAHAIRAHVGEILGEEAAPSVRGRAGVLIQLHDAWQTIRAGSDEPVILCGTDSFAHPHVLATYDRERRVKTDVNSDGFIPGQGSGALLVGSAGWAKRHGLPIQAEIIATGRGLEPGLAVPQQPHRGEALAQAVQTMREHLPSGWKADRIWSSMNGERIWAKEYGILSARCSSLASPASTLHHPADRLGELGAASAAALLALGGSMYSCIGNANLICASADHGEVAVAATRSTRHQAAA